MNHKTKILLVITLFALLLTGTALVAANAAAGADAANYQLSWWTVDSGGGSSQSADGLYTLSGTISQPDAGFAAGGEYTLHSGFWQQVGAAIQEFWVYLPLVTR